MRKNILFVIIAVLAACTSNGGKNNGLVIKFEREVPANAPMSIKNAVKNAPKDVLVGVGTAKLANIGTMRSMAESRARVEIARQINRVTTEIIRYYSVKSEVDPSQEEIFRETITVSLSKATLVGCSIIREEFDDDGACWVVVMMDKSNLVTHVSGVQEDARNAVLEMASFDAVELLNAASF
jgi:hypothetical protein